MADAYLPRASRTLAAELGTQPEGCATNATE